MAKPLPCTSKTLKATIYLLLLAITLRCANSARILDDVSDPTATDIPDVAPVAGPTTALPSGQIPATATDATMTAPAADVAPISTAPSTTPPSGQILATDATVAAPAADDVAPITAPSTTLPSEPTPVAATSPGGTAITDPQHHVLSFFMHDIQGGSHPSGRAVTGIVANSGINGIPFSTPNGQIFPLTGGAPLNNINGMINSNNAPLLVGLNGSPTSTVIQNSGNNNIVNGGNNLPFVNAGQLPAGTTLQQLIFGSTTVVDDELTKGHELGSAVVGTAQGFYLSSSLDGTSHTIALTALFHGGDHHDHDLEDSISFFGVHRTGSPVSQIAVIGGTGKYEDAKGYATIETLHQEDQHTTDGVETITQFSVYLTL